MDVNQYLHEISIIRIGEVCSVNGRTIHIRVDKDKNLSHLLFKGTLIKNVTVGSYLKILKGFTQIVAQVESESIIENTAVDATYHQRNEEFSRQLIVKLLGYFENETYHKGVKEIPLIGNVCILLSNDEFSLMHRFSDSNDLTIKIGHLLSDENVPIEIGLSKLFTSHIGIFGNTGSGKSYTLASIYKRMFDKVANNRRFQDNARFLLFDFNGEYSARSVITNNKKTYICETRTNTGDKIPITKEDILKPELVYILANATEKTQQPFIKRALRLYNNIHKNGESLNQIKDKLRNLVRQIVCMTDYLKAKLLLDYMEQILPSKTNESGIEIGLQTDLNWHGVHHTFFTIKEDAARYFNSSIGQTYINQLIMYEQVDRFEEDENFVGVIIQYMYIQLVMDVLNNRAVNEHIAPAIKKLQSIKPDVEKIFVVSDDIKFWGDKNFVVIDLNKTNINMKKLVPLIVSSKLYNSHKMKFNGNSSLNIIVDEAHNILSYESMRESESWKDFRLETFEEIIKEGRKFGVFLTIASQRPSDISSTIISQLHNYLIHRLINNKDLDMIEKAISYLDKLSIESLPILPVGACVLSGVMADLPVTIQIDAIGSEFKPTSDNISLQGIWIDDESSQQV